jgi:hypothetical protein
MMLTLFPCILGDVERVQTQMYVNSHIGFSSIMMSHDKNLLKIVIRKMAKEGKIIILVIIFYPK